MSNILWADRIGAPTFGEFMATLPFPPTAEQQDVIQAQAPALLVVAGAGSGKTATMSQRIVWHVAAGHVQPGEVLGLTFTRKAAGELSERVSAGLAAARAAGLLPEHGAQSDPPTVATYNSFAAEIAASYALLIGEDPRARLITEAERWQIMDYLVSEWGAREGQKISDDHPFAQAAPSTIVAVALELAAAITDNGIALDTARNFLEREIAALTQLSTARTAAGYFRKGPYSGTEVPAGFNALARSDSSLRLRWAAIDLVAEYFAYKRENSLVEFADQVAWAGKILQAAPEIGARLRSRFKLILLDEYQDTSPNQAQFLRAAFFSERKLEEQKADMPSAACGDLADASAVCTETAALRCAPVVSVCAVGDPNQAIYGWRGAGADSLADFAREFQVAPEARFTLSTAFRNSTKILAVANALTAESSHTDVKMLLREEFPKAGVLDRPWLAEKSAHSQADSLALPVLHPAPAAPPGKVVHIHCNLSGEEHDAIARAIREEFAAAACQRERDVQRAQQERKQLRPYQPPTAAVLVRKHKYAQPMMEALQAQGLTCVNVSGQMLGSAPEIRTVRALLGIAFFPSRGDLLVQVLNFFALGVQDLRALGSIRRTIPVAGSQRVSLVEAAAEVARRGREEAVREGFTPTGYLRIQKVAAAAQRLRDMGQLPVAEIVQIACEELGLFELAASRVTGGASMGRTLSRFLATASSFDGQTGGAAYRSELPIQSFLRWLEVAERTERGSADDSSDDLQIATGVVDIEPEAGVVQVLTVHAAKGLEWDIVAVPELVHGEFDALLPGEARSWHTDAHAVPWPLRADHHHLPDFSIYAVTHGELATPEHVGEAGGRFWAYSHGALVDHENEQVRRLMYVALTRARTALILGTSSYSSWEKVQTIAAKMEQAKLKPPKNGSTGWEAPRAHIFLDEIAARVNRGALTADSANAAAIDSEEQFSEWVRAELDHRSEQGSGEIGLIHFNKLETVQEILQAEATGQPIPQVAMWPRAVQRSLESSDLAELQFDTATVDTWARNTQLILAEREELSDVGGQIDHLTASDVVALRADPVAFARDRQRPIPREPSLSAQRGTAVHAKIAQAFHLPSVLNIDEFADPEEMPLDMDMGLTDERAEQLYERAMNSRFAALEPLAIEQSVEITVAGYPVRCVIDAVFRGRESAGGEEIVIVDWKTGRRPSPDQLRSRYLQLALYRLAWARAHRLPADVIGAYFYYLGEEDPTRRELKAEPMEFSQLEEEVRELLAHGAASFHSRSH